MSLEDAFEATVKSNHLVVDGVDDALVEAGRKIAAQVDEAVEVGGQEATKALYLVPHLMNVLREMGATPKSRVDLGAAVPKGDKPTKASGLGKFRVVS